MMNGGRPPNGEEPQEMTPRRRWFSADRRERRWISAQTPAGLNQLPGIVTNNASPGSRLFPVRRGKIAQGKECCGCGAFPITAELRGGFAAE